MAEPLYTKEKKSKKSGFHTRIAIAVISSAIAMLMIYWAFLPQEKPDSESVIPVTTDQDTSEYVAVTYETSYAMVTEQLPNNTVIDMLPIPVKTGYVFDGWVDEDDNKIKQSDIVSDNLILHASWKKSGFLLTYDASPGTFSDGSVQKTVFVEYDNVDLQDPKDAWFYDGYELTGWQYHNESWDGLKYASLPDAKDLTVYAEYRVSPSIVTYYVGQDTSDMVYEFFESTRLVAADVPVAKPEFVFQGWTTSETSGDVVYAPGDEILIGYPEKVNLYPLWKKFAFPDVDVSVTTISETTFDKVITITGSACTDDGLWSVYLSSPEETLLYAQIPAQSERELYLQMTEDQIYDTVQIKGIIDDVLMDLSSEVSLAVLEEETDDGGVVVDDMVEASLSDDEVNTDDIAQVARDALNSEARNKIKGLLPYPLNIGTEDFDSLQLSQVAYNIELSYFLDKQGGAGFVYDYNGKRYEFSQAAVVTYDNLIKQFQDKNLIVTMILCNEAHRANPLIYGGQIHQGSHLYMLDTSASSLELIEALGAFFGERYGYISNWILGNEIDAYQLWNYMPVTNINQYVDEYIKGFRSFYKGLRAKDVDAKLFFSLTGNWTKQINGQYPGKDILDLFAKQVGDDIEWHLAYHPYNAPILDTSAWSSKEVFASFNTKSITMQNISVLTSYLGRKELLLPNRERRTVILSEFGYTSTNGHEEDQAMSIAYAWEKAKSNPYISAFLLTREIDAPEEVAAGLASGLRNVDGSKKQSWEVFRKLGTSEEAAVLEQMREYVKRSDQTETIIASDEEFQTKLSEAITIPAETTGISGRTVFVGDSRTIDMFADSDATISGEDHDGIKVFAGHGKGYSWMAKVIDDYGHENFDTLVSWMGANDRGSFGNYKGYYEKLLAEGKKIILCTVGPTVDHALSSWDHPHYINNNMVHYNTELVSWASAHGVRVVDLYTYVKDNIQTDGDGIHYTPRPTTKLWQYILSQLNS